MKKDRRSVQKERAAKKEEVFAQAAALISARDYKHASEVLEQAVELCDVDDVQMLVSIDTFYRQTDDYKMRLTIVDKLLRFGVDPKLVLPFKVFHLSALHRYKEALTASEIYFKNFGMDLKVYEAVARIYQDMGCAADAVPYVEKLLDDADQMPFENGMRYYSTLINTQSYTRVYGINKYKSLLSRIHRLTAGYERPLPPSGGGYFKTLRVAYMSPDFRAHPIGYFIYPVIMHMPAHEHVMSCFSLYHVDKTESSENMYGINFSADFKSRAKYQVIEHMTDERKAKTIMRDKPDVAFDLSSHTMGNRLELFAKRLAPVQVSYIGWPSSTGIAAMDYTLVDAITDLPGAEELYTEKLIRMSKTSLCHVLTPSEPPAAEPPVKKNGYITFGCFCNIQKMTPDTVRLFARVLKAVKGSRLLLKGRYPDEVTEDMLRRFTEAGLAKKNITIEQQTDYPACYHRVDIILDTIPFNGATTTCDALNMGVPVVTVTGDIQSARRGLSILHNVGVEELVASTQDDYVRIAVALAADIPRLQFYRNTLREIKMRSNLADYAAFVAEFACHVRKTWIDCCRAHNLPATDYSLKTDDELANEMQNAQAYIQFDQRDDVMEEYRRLEAAFIGRGIDHATAD